VVNEVGRAYLPWSRRKARFRSLIHMSEFSLLLPLYAPNGMCGNSLWRMSQGKIQFPQLSPGSYTFESRTPYRLILQMRAVVAHRNWLAQSPLRSGRSRHDPLLDMRGERSTTTCT
jgi:hypothetical protein